MSVYEIELDLGPANIPAIPELWSYSFSDKPCSWHLPLNTKEKTIKLASDWCKNHRIAYFYIVEFKIKEIHGWDIVNTHDCDGPGRIAEYLTEMNKQMYVYACKPKKVFLPKLIRKQWKEW